jgi:hypothetical protein
VVHGSVHDPCKINCVPETNAFLTPTHAFSLLQESLAELLIGQEKIGIGEENSKKKRHGKKHSKHVAHSRKLLMTYYNPSLQSDKSQYSTVTLHVSVIYLGFQYKNPASRK